MIRNALSAAIASGALLAAGPAAAAGINFDAFSYTGTVTPYDTESDARNDVNALSGPHTIPTGTNGSRSTLPNARDGAVFVDQGSGSFAFLTAWYFTPQANLGKADGFGNPNNTNTGFVQLFDTDGSSVDNLSLSRNPDFTSFSVSASGTNAGGSEFARLWPAPTTGGAPSISGGRFLDYAFDMTATFSTPDGDSTRSGETPQDVSGSFTGVFENTGTDPSLNNFYTVDFTLQSGSSAEDNDYVAQFRSGSTFATTAARTFEAPVPATPLLLVAGLAGLGFAGGRRRSR